MGKRKFKRSMASLPKGLPQRGKHVLDNPFVSGTRQQKRPKHEVHNRNISNNNNNKQSALARSLQRRQDSLKSHLQNEKKSNSFVDRRIGEYTMTREEKDLARIVRERSRRSRKSAKFSLNDDEEGGGDQMLTHKGKAIDDLDARDHVLLSSDDEDERGDLEAIDTELHFGGGNMRQTQNPYGPAGADKDQSMEQVYSQRKTELDDLIARRKILKAERVKSRETQVEAFENMDESFKDLASLLNFRDKEQERKESREKKKQGTMSQQEVEMEEWNKEMKEYLFERKVKATDRTKTPEEIATEEAERLHELETKRLARMSGDFENDNLSDISEDENDTNPKKSKKKKKKKKKRRGSRNPEELEDDDSDGGDNQDGLEARFTADGLVYVDKTGRVVKKMGEEDQEEEDVASSGDESDASESDTESETVDASSGDFVAVGTRVQGNYRVKEQYEGQESWYDGVITKVNTAKDGSISYDVIYDDGDYEYDMEPENVKAIQKTSSEKQEEECQKNEDMIKKRKRQKAKEQARQEIPFVFEVPTTLEALHDMIGKYASTGADASLIIQRIQKSNSVRLDKRNTEKMQNFYDVLLRRFIAVGDAIFSSGDGGAELGRFAQLDSLTQTLYSMSQESPSCAGAVWGRRLGVFHNALAKRLRDAELLGDDEEDEESAWLSTGSFLLLRCLGHIFPVTDNRHQVVTPALLLLGQMISQTPVRSKHDLVMGVLCAGLIIEYTKEAERVAPEALAFLAGALRLFTVDSKTATHPFPIPNLEVACGLPVFQHLRTSVADVDDDTETPKLCLHHSKLDDVSIPAAILCSVLELIKVSANHLKGNLNHTENEIFSEVSQSLLLLMPSSKKKSLPSVVSKLVADAALAVSSACKQSASRRKPLQRRIGPSVSERAIKTLAPKMEDPSRYVLSKDKGKTALQATIDRTRREYKREHKAVARELRLDAAFIEDERRKEKSRKDAEEREKRNKNFAWLEGEQAAMNQQVRMGGGLLSGGGTGAARAKVKTAQMGMKKGGKFR